MSNDAGPPPDARRNRLAVIAERATGSVAHDILAPGLVLTALVHDLGGGAMVVGTLEALLVLAGVSQLLTAYRLQREAGRRRFVLRVAGGALLLLPVLAAVLWGLAESRPRLVLGLLLGLLFLRWSLTAMCNPALLDLSRKLISPDERHKVFALRQLAAAACGVAGAGLTYGVLRGLAMPANYVVLVLASAAVGALSWLAVFLMRERGRGPRPQRLDSPREFVAQLFRLLRPGRGGAAEHRFRHYVAVRHAVYVSRAAYPFVALYALQGFEVSRATVGLFMVARWGGRLTSGLLLTLVPRLRRTPQRILRFALAGTLVGLVCAVATPRWEGLFVTFFLSGAFLEAYLVADPIFMMAHAPPGREVLGMSLTIVALYPMRILLPLAAGILFATVGFPVVAAVALAGGAVAFAAAGGLHAREQAPPEHPPGAME
ncbi:MAG: hypothetical protein ACLF0G_13940 [Candidatus Brocadiia bacterium]